ncbi:hypothetical protein HPP92_013266 [Vanilla planifolia]|uniref:Di19 C-terminal domain-containing protein n=1 Tax=Vanilla planifolia TaxID=51239 RepID=A0A835R1L9_VANPL|nr:hypothetical protein HPP92_013266 [Vanilla planifolia]
MQRRRRFRRGSSGSQPTLSALRKELKEVNIQALLGGLSQTIHSDAPDPLLSSLIYTFPTTDSSKDIQSVPLEEGNFAGKSSEETVVESSKPFLSDKEQEEQARRCEFVHGLVLSTIFDEIL